MADTSVKNILENEIPTLLKTRPELAKDINAVIHFNVTGENGGTWTMDLTKSSEWVTTGAQGTPKMTITVSAKAAQRADGRDAGQAQVQADGHGACDEAGKAPFLSVLARLPANHSPFARRAVEPSRRLR